MLNVSMQNVVMLNTIMLNVSMQHLIMLSVITSILVLNSGEFWPYVANKKLLMLLS